MKLTPFKLICLIFVVSLCLGNQYGVSARSNAQDLIETISPPLSPDLTWEYLGNVKKVAFSMGGTLTLSGEMYEAVECASTISALDYYSTKNMESLGWIGTGAAGTEGTYWHASGRYLTVGSANCANPSPGSLFKVWLSEDNNPPPPMYRIHGYVGVGGAALQYGLNTATAQNNGYYSFPVLYGWSGVVTPHKAGYSFSPSSVLYTNITGHQFEEDYKALPAAAGKAVLIFPSGGIGTNYNPAYIWNRVNNSTWYYLWVDGPSGNVIKQWYTSAQANCNSTTCFVTPATALADGEYSWKVMTYTSAGDGPWSESTNFAVGQAEPTLVGPQGDIGRNYNPTYTWNKVTDSTWYLFEFSYYPQTWWEGGHWYESAEICNDTTCSVTPYTPYGGTYNWRVMSYRNEAGHRDGLWSSGMSFSTPAPVATSLVTPTGSITSRSPTYTWDQVDGSAFYYLRVDGPKGNVIDESYYWGNLDCNGTTCSITPAMTLANGEYTWKVMTNNNAGDGPWSESLNFIVGPGAATLVTPSGDIAANYNPTYTWNQVTDSTWYLLQVNGPNGQVIYQWYTAAQANCNSSTCSVTPSTTLAGGAYTWWVMTYNSGGDGRWSAGMNFSITVPGAATLLTPNGNIGASHNPTYSWNQVTGSTWYLLQVNGLGGRVVYQWYTAAEAACDGTTCSITPSAPLGGGAYTWWVMTYTSAGDGPWSAGMGFTVSP